MKKRPVFLATIAVLLIGGAGATGIFLVGSKQRRDDRAAYLAYERAVLERIAGLESIRSPSFAAYLGELRTGRMSEEEALGRSSNWRGALVRARAGLVALTPPAFLSGVEVRWTAAIDAYVRVVDAFARAAGLTGASRMSSLDEAAEAIGNARERFDGASGLMQFHRRRLGLGATASLSDPAKNE